MKIDIYEIKSFADRGTLLGRAVDMAEAFPEDEERSEALDHLRRDGVYVGGGGAAPAFRVVPSDIERKDPR